ncbi:MAG: threonylcarbamoyl-AMP synthase, partial [Rikenellaceae bacterium]|nr:threonylcarbamoyl-AMP synthase [Rikenellaceae bacterium]
AIERIKAIRGKKETDMAIICSDLSHIADYARVDTPTFKLMKRNLPGAFTFILPASGKVPDKFLEKRKNVGIRIPDSPIALALVALSGHPLVTVSVKDDEMVEYTTDPELIDEKYGTLVDAVIDGGYGEAGFSTVVDCTGEEPEIVREGLGELL